MFIARTVFDQVARERVDLGMTESEILGAFSSHVDGETEKHLNGFFLKSASDAKKARLLFVAHKFETGYDNPAVTCLYVFRNIDASTLATQVLLRHCSKRAGKIRPITVDFANRDGQLLEVTWRTQTQTSERNTIFISCFIG